MKFLMNQIKPEKEKKKKNFDKIKEFEVELVKIKYANNPDKLQSALKEIKFKLLIKIDRRLNKN